MPNIDLKTLTPDTSLPADAVIFGADSQSATSPSVYPVSNFARATDAASSYGPGKTFFIEFSSATAATNDALIAAKLAEIIAAAPTIHSRAVLYARAPTLSVVNIATPFKIPDFCDFYQMGGFYFEYASSGVRTGAVLTVGSTSTQDSYGSWHGLDVRISNPAVHHFWDVADGGTCDTNKFCGVRVASSTWSTISIKHVSGFPIGVQLFPVPAGITAHNRVFYDRIVLNKIAFDLRGNTSSAWVNENVFYGPGDIIPSSSLNNYGSCYGVRFSAEASGYTGQNNNRFVAPCFQINDAATKWAATTAVTAGFRRPHLGNDYLAVTSGTTSGSGPTHTSGTVTNGTVDFKYVGPYRRSPFLFVNAGGFNHAIDCRIEGGYGAPIQIYNDSNNAAGKYSSISVSFLEEAFSVSPPNWSMGGTTDAEFHTVASGGQNEGVTATVIRTNDPRVKTKEIPSLRQIAVIGASGIFVPGCPIVDSFSGAGVHVSAYKSLDTRLTKFGLYYNVNADGPGLLIPVSGRQRKFLIEWHPVPGAPNDPPRMGIRALGEDLLNVAHTAADPAFIGDKMTVVVTDVRSARGSDAWGAEPIYVRKANVRFLAVHFGLGYVDSLSVTQYTSLIPGTVAGESTNIVSEVTDERFGISGGNRRSPGTPTAGVFPYVGERIEDITSTTTWRVTTAGVLAPAWVTGTAVFAGEYRSNAGRVYSAAAAGTTGATAPTHTSGSVSDGTVTWDHVGLTAVLA